MPKEPIIEDIRIGEGREASHRDIAEIRLSMQLSKGDYVLKDEAQSFQIGSRSVVAGLETGVIGMKVGGIRKISFGPHLGYRDQTFKNIPANAKLICQAELLGLYDENDPAGPTGIRRMVRK